MTQILNQTLSRRHQHGLLEVVVLAGGLILVEVVVTTAAGALAGALARALTGVAARRRTLHREL